MIDLVRFILSRGLKRPNPEGLFDRLLYFFLPDDAHSLQQAVSTAPKRMYELPTTATMLQVN